MDLSDEVCIKIKSAIKARLKELGIIWDRELPDYVMVLIKNKKSKEQMENDLNIFLGSHTAGFTDWLHDVWKKLEACAVTSKGPKKKEEEKKLKVKRRASDDSQFDFKRLRSTGTPSAELNYGSDTDISINSQINRGKSPLHRNENGFHTHSVEESKDIWDKRLSQSGQHRNPDKDEPRKPRERIQISWTEDNSSTRENRNPSRTRRDRSRSQRSQSRSRRSRSSSQRRSRSKSRLKDGKNGGVSVLRRKGKDSRYRERSGSRDRRVCRDAREFIRRGSQERRNGYGGKSRKSEKNNYEMERTSKSQNKDLNEDKLPSLVKITPRPIRPLSMQPPSNLILKAVADAQKSIAVTSLPQPEDKLGHDDDNKKTAHNKSGFKKKIGPNFEPNISITLLNDRISSTKIDVPEPEEVPSENAYGESRVPEVFPDVPRFTISLQSDDDSIYETDHDENESSPLDLSVNTQLPDPEPEPMDISSVTPSEENIAPEYPVYRFDRSRLGPRVAPVVPDADTVLSCLAPSGKITKTIVNENAFSECSETRTDENDKLIKCKFWPSCEAGESCRFYHPKTYCRTLPNCKFGQKCLFIHPPCKFGDKCLNVTCPYTHTAAASQTPSVTGKVWTKVPLAPSNGQICMFFPNCTKPFCPYQHYAAPGSGIPCKYGANCTKLSCEFDHPQSSKNPYKWVAQSQE